VAVGNFDLKIPTENIPSVNPLVFSEFLVVIGLDMVARPTLLGSDKELSGGLKINPLD
jgi:hypothetical protein